MLWLMPSYSACWIRETSWSRSIIAVRSAFRPCRARRIKIDLQRLLPDLGVQGLEVHGGVLLALLATEHAGGPFQKLAPPCPDLGRMDIEFLRQLGQGLFAPQDLLWPYPHRLGAVYPLSRPVRFPELLLGCGLPYSSFSSMKSIELFPIWI